MRFRRSATVAPAPNFSTKRAPVKARTWIVAKASDGTKFAVFAHHLQVLDAQRQRNRETREGGREEGRKNARKEGREEERAQVLDALQQLLEAEAAKRRGDGLGYVRIDGASAPDRQARAPPGKPV